jgi:hypothetical protein
MSEHKHEPGKSHNFSLAFEQMCSFVAIASTKNADETLRELIMQCLVILPDERFENPQHVANVLDVLFGLQIPLHEIQTGLDVLEANNLVQRPTGSNYTLPMEVRAKLQDRINLSAALEDKIRQEWLHEISEKYAMPTPDQMWTALRNYLARAFRRHGIQAAALFDPSVDIDSEQADSLSVLLKESLKGTSYEQHPMARSAIASFFASVSDYPDRATYIAQLADGAFNYFSLTIAPDVAERFRQNLSPLSLFLDTNFLFGILGLSVNSQVEVSNELLKSIAKHGLPFDLLYHRRTERELTGSLAFHKSVLLSRSWPRSISRAATTSRYMNGIELMYHQQHAEIGIDVETFFRPFEHVDVMLQNRNISVFRPPEDRQNQRAHLLNEYKDWLEGKRRIKPYNVIDHDTTVLDQVRQLRSDVASSLEAGALLITCDYNLFRFDWETSRAQGRAASTVLPNLLWQTLRPFIPSDSDFDRSFAETFALPEFRTIGSGASAASSKLLYVLASYKDLPEETAAKMLSNDLLIDTLRTAENDQKFQEYVEAAIVTENAALIEEKAAMAAQLEHEMASRHKTEELLTQRQSDLEREKAEAEKSRRVSEEALKQKDEERQRADQIGTELEQQRKQREDAERLAADALKREAETREKSDLLISIVKGGGIGVIAIVLFEWTVNNVALFNGFLQHSRSLSIQLSIDGIILFAILGVCMPKIRKWLWGVGIFGIALVILQVI